MPCRFHRHHTAAQGPSADIIVCQWRFLDLFNCYLRLRANRSRQLFNKGTTLLCVVFRTNSSVIIGCAAGAVGFVGLVVIIAVYFRRQAARALENKRRFEARMYGVEEDEVFVLINLLSERPF